MPANSITKKNFLFSQLIKKFTWKRKNLHMAFIYLGKTCNRELIVKAVNFAIVYDKIHPYRLKGEITRLVCLKERGNICKRCMWRENYVLSWC